MNRFLLLLFTCLLLSSCEELDIKQEMTQFDEVFIPTWYYSYTKDLVRASMAANTMMQQWQNLKTDYQYISGSSVDWQETYDCIDELMSQSIQAIEQKNLTHALNYLEGIKFELAELRRRYHIPYYLDKVWSFQSAYDLVYQFAHPDYIFTTEWHEFDCLVEDMNLAWAEVVNSKLDTNWNPTKQQRFEVLKTTITAQLKQFDRDVKKANVESDILYSKVKQIQTTMLALIKLFGQFGSLDSGQIY
jgi:hypothetical protein